MWPCDELQGVSLPSPCVSWDGLQQPPVAWFQEDGNAWMNQSFDCGLDKLQMKKQNKENCSTESGEARKNNLDVYARPFLSFLFVSQINQNGYYE